MPGESSATQAEPGLQYFSKTFGRRFCATHNTYICPYSDKCKRKIMSANQQRVLLPARPHRTLRRFGCQTHSGSSISFGGAVNSGVPSVASGYSKILPS